MTRLSFGSIAGRPRLAAIGGGAVLLVAVIVVAVVLIGQSGHGDGTRQVANQSSESSPPNGSEDLNSSKPSASAKAKPKATQDDEPPALQPVSEISDRVDWAPFSQTYGAATAAATASKQASNGVTHVQASQSFGDYNSAGLVSVSADAQYFASASQARNRYDSTCGNGTGKKSGSLAAANLGDRSCSYVSDVSNGASGSAILYVQVLRNNVILQVAPMAYHNGAWSDADLAKLRTASVQCAGATVAKL